jgi:hypothetical protein
VDEFIVDSPALGMQRKIHVSGLIVHLVVSLLFDATLLVLVSYPPRLAVESVPHPCRLLKLQPVAVLPHFSSLTKKRNLSLLVAFFIILLLTLTMAAVGADLCF